MIITDSQLLYEGELFKRETNEPTNYTIVLKYRADSMTVRPTFVKMNLDGAQVIQCNYYHLLF